MTKAKKESKTNETVTISNLGNVVTETQEQQAIPSFTSPSEKIFMDEFIDALNVIIAGINIAQSKGAYNIEEAGRIWNSILKIHEVLNQ